MGPRSAVLTLGLQPLTNTADLIPVTEASTANRGQMKTDAVSFEFAEIANAL